MIQNPNITLWSRYKRYSSNRASLILNQLSPLINNQKCRILDIGCGSCGIAKALARENLNVIATDIVLTDDSRHLPDNVSNLQLVQADGRALCFAPKSFDGIILADTLEHVQNPGQVLEQISNCLNDSGWVYITTPNKWSPFNFLMDPHTSLPIVSILPKNITRKITVDFFHWHSTQKKDIAELLSYRQLTTLAKQANLSIQFINKNVARFGFDHPESIWSRKSHLLLIKWIVKMGLSRFVLFLINNHHGVFNKFFNPTWFLIARKQSIILND